MQFSAGKKVKQGLSWSEALDGVDLHLYLRQVPLWLVKMAR